ncbi:MAG: cell division protein FtsQ/DivIB [Alphaproteobacteria bacterium]
MRKVKVTRPERKRVEPGAALARLRYRVRRLALRLRPAGIALACVLSVGGLYMLWSGGMFDRVLNATSTALAETAVQQGFRVRTVHVEGNRLTSAVDLSGAIGVGEGDALMQTDLEAVRERVEKLGWVANARVSRNWPDTLFVAVEERKPFAIWQYREQHRLIDRAGTVIPGVAAGSFGHLPQVVGDGANVHAAEFLALLEARPVLQGRVRAASRIGERRWNLILDGGVTVRLPEGREAEALDELIALEKEHNILARGVSMIDMRFTDRLIVRLEEGRKPASAKKKPGTGKMAGDREA